MLITNSTNNKKFFIKIIYLLVSFFILSSAAFSKCDFKSSEYLEELNDLQNIVKIEIRTPKNSDFSKNFLRIYLSESKIIEPKYKKKFFANLIVKYKFGKCEYKSEVRQTGDFKDHLRMEEGGNILRSLNVKLLDGNILNAVRFKLLIPETRYNIHEVLGTVILREFGFITPETFQTKVKLNNSEALMLFQEDMSKELIEKNKRREGPMFEGDETLLKSEKDLLSLKYLSLSRLANKNWFLKGGPYSEITLRAYSEIQNKHLEFKTEDNDKKGIIFCNQNDKKIMLDFCFSLLAMNGLHGLSPNNRRYYFNLLKNQFEPVYYDGGLRLSDDINLNRRYIKNIFKKNYQFSKTDNFTEDIFLSKLQSEFRKRIINYNNDSEFFFNLATSKIAQNINKLKLSIKENQFKINNENETLITFDSRIKKYNTIQKKYGVKQNFIIDYKKYNKKYSLLDTKKNNLEISDNEMGKLLSRNTLVNKRYVFLPNQIGKKKYDERIIKYNDKILSNIYGSQSIDIKVDKINKIINIRQNHPKDWAVFENSNLDNWKIVFEGINFVNSEIDETNKFRMNKFGLTGCITFYESKFNNTTLKANNGSCEDSINIISSYGNIKKVNIQKSEFDSIDIDFSEININEIEVYDAGNDCIDFSSGKYFINESILVNCKDKAISVGEGSHSVFKKINIKNSNMGIASKDSSKTYIDSLYLNKVNTCFASYKKKQEFFGGYLEIKNFECKNYKKENLNDLSSKINIIEKDKSL